jgi:hypothetical protein
MFSFGTLFPLMTGLDRVFLFKTNGRITGRAVMAGLTSGV